MRPTVQMIAVDMDGTLLNHQKVISQQNKDALRTWHSKGAHIVLASGRMIPSLDEIAKELDIDCFLMGYNGGACVDRVSKNRKMIFHNPLPSGVIDLLIDFCQEHGHFLNVYLDGKLFGINSPDLRKYPDGYAYLNGAKYELVDSYDQFRGTTPTKALIIKHSTSERDLLFEQVKEMDQFTGLHFSTTLSYNDTGFRQDYLEFMNPSVNKGTGLAKLCKELNVDPAGLVALGDANNDIEMLQFAGMGICMAQGTEEAKRAAKKISQWTNEEHGVANELIQILELHHPNI